MTLNITGLYNILYRSKILYEISAHNLTILDALIKTQLLEMKKKNFSLQTLWSEIKIVNCHKMAGGETSNFPRGAKSRPADISRVSFRFILIDLESIEEGRAGVWELRRILCM